LASKLCHFPDLICRKPHARFPSPTPANKSIERLPVQREGTWKYSVNGVVGRRRAVPRRGRRGIGAPKAKESPHFTPRVMRLAEPEVPEILHARKRTDNDDSGRNNHHSSHDAETDRDGG
jgi:hypothetical protein